MNSLLALCTLSTCFANLSLAQEPTREEVVAVKKEAEAEQGKYEKIRASITAQKRMESVAVTQLFELAEHEFATGRRAFALAAADQLAGDYNNATTRFIVARIQYQTAAFIMKKCRAILKEATSTCTHSGTLTGSGFFLSTHSPLDKWPYIALASANCSFYRFRKERRHWKKFSLRRVVLFYSRLIRTPSFFFRRY